MVRVHYCPQRNKSQKLGFKRCLEQRFLRMIKLNMEENKLKVIKYLGMVAAISLIIFGSFDNIWRTMKLAINKVVNK